MAPRYPLASVDHALQIVELLRVEPSMRLSDVAAAVGVANSTAHRLLATLSHRGFVVQQVVSKRYSMGPALIDIGRSALLLSELPDRARPLLESFRDRLGETIHLGIREGTRVSYLDAAESPRAVRVASRAGRRLDAHLSSIGKALLASVPDESLRRLYAHGSLEPATPASIDSVDRLMRELVETRRRGYAVNTGESEPDVSSVAVAIVDPTGVAIAAIGCSAPRHRLPPSEVEHVAAVLRDGIAAFDLTGHG